MGVGDFERAASHIEPIGASFVLAIENGLSDQELAELLESGWPAELTESFWASFRSDFGLFAGSGLGDIVVGRHRDLAVGEGTFARVEVEFDGTQGWIIARADPNGAWKIDLMATLDGAFAPLVFDRVAVVGDDAAADLVVAAMSSSVLVSLDAAAVAYPEDVRLETEIARIRQVLGSR